MKRNVQIEVMIKPIGKIPSVVPGKTNGAGCLASSAAAAAIAMDLVLNQPFTKAASRDESIVLTVRPSVVLAVSVTIGSRSIITSVLEGISDQNNRICV